jgi:hypothetical protein
MAGELHSDVRPRSSEGELGQAVLRSDSSRSSIASAHGLPSRAAIASRRIPLYFASSGRRKPSTMIAAGSVRQAGSVVPAAASLLVDGTCRSSRRACAARCAGSRRLSSSSRSPPPTRGRSAGEGCCRSPGYGYIVAVTSCPGRARGVELGDERGRLGPVARPVALRCRRSPARRPRARCAAPRRSPRAGGPPSERMCVM